MDKETEQAVGRLNNTLWWEIFVPDEAKEALKKKYIGKGKS